MNPYYQIALEHLTVEELKEIIAIKEKKNLKPMSAKEKRINELMNRNSASTKII